VNWGSPATAVDGFGKEFLVTWKVGPEASGDLEARLDQPAVASQPQVRDYLAVWDDLPAKRLFGRPAATGGMNGFVVPYPQRSFALSQAVTVAGSLRPPVQISTRRGAAIRYGSLSIPAVTARTRRGGDMLAVWSGPSQQRRRPRHLRPPAAGRSPLSATSQPGGGGALSPRRARG
jgi:hypothetical protein